MMDLSSARILTTSSISNIPSGAIIIPAIRANSSTQNKNFIHPLQIGDASIQKLRTISTTPLIRTSNDLSNNSPTVFIMNNNSNKLDAQRPMTVNRLVLANNNNNYNTTNQAIISGQNAMNVPSFVNSISTLNQIALVQSTNRIVSSQNSIAKLLETPINVVQQPTSLANDIGMFKY